MTSLLMLLILAALIWAEDPVVRVQQGLLRGMQLVSLHNREFMAFLGVPYAAPPVGDLRFKTPQPSAPWEGVRNATEEGHSCPQHAMMTGKITGDEDCLYLNVFTTKLPPRDNPAAVMVWVHGGCYKGGSATPTVYGPDHLLEEEVVVVTINYRLGLLGFLALSEEGVSGNFGLKDQTQALRWVRDNIAQFGGNPDRVTLFGESAGASSVHLHLLSPLSRGLFHGAIAQSGSALAPWAYAEPSFMRAKAFTVGERMHCNASNVEELLRCLRNAPASDIVDATIGREFSTSETVVPVRPTREKPGPDAFLTDHPGRLMTKGLFKPVPLISGVNSREAIIYMEDMKSLPNFYERLDEHVRAIMADLLGIDDVSKAEELYLMARDYYVRGDSPHEQAIGILDLFSDLAFVRGSIQSVALQVRLTDVPARSYMFAFEGSLGLARLAFNTEFEGVSHADELGYLWHTIISPPVEEHSAEMTTVHRVVKMWTNFAKTGDPSVDSGDKLLNVRWGAATPSDAVYLNIDREMSLQRNLLLDRMHFWDDMLGNQTYADRK
ncbi:carboxylic ester hydrolase-like [Periplaneta americana]|uniref:carboxylic ester hydrolase-like n=1 Tax=Periplaneta americana TaxID=6978 RepID=UPI0037E79330